MTKPFEHEGRTYTFERSRGSVKPIRDDGCTMWSTYPSYKGVRIGVLSMTYRAHMPAFSNIWEAKNAIMNQPQPTFVHMPVWARTAEEAARIREEMEN